MQFPKQQKMHPSLSNLPTNLYSQLIPRAQLTQEQNYRYYQEYKKLYYTAWCIHKQSRDFIIVNEEIISKLSDIQANIQGIKTGNKDRGSSEEISKANKPKRFRRTNEMIQKPYRCVYEKCDKSYASEGSLQQHIKLKHDDQSPPEQYHVDRHRRGRNSKDKQLQLQSRDNDRLKDLSRQIQRDRSESRYRIDEMQMNKQRKIQKPQQRIKQDSNYLQLKNSSLNSKGRSNEQQEENNQQSSQMQEQQQKQSKQQKLLEPSRKMMESNNLSKQKMDLNQKQNDNSKMKLKSRSQLKQIDSKQESANNINSSKS